MTIEGTKYKIAITDSPIYMWRTGSDHSITRIGTEENDGEPLYNWDLCQVGATAAEINAIKTLVFIGAPGTVFQVPLVTSDISIVETKHKDIFNELYESAYRNFIESSVTVTSYGKDAEKRKCITLDIRIRAKALRSWLENKGVIRKFGL